MQIECPNCGTRYRVDAGRLRPEGTRVRCSACDYRFLAFPEGDSGETWDLDLGPGEQEGSAPPDEPPDPFLDPAGAGGEVAPATVPGRPRRRRQGNSPRRAGSWLLGLLVLLLLGGLVAELGYAFRSQLLAQPWVRSAVQGGLHLTGLDWELPIALRHYQVQAVNARLVTLASGRRVTLVEGLLQNGAPFAQRPPKLELRADGPGGQVRFRRIRPPGARFELTAAITPEALGRHWERAQAAFPEAMRPGQEEPFVVVLTDVPPGVRRFQVAMVE